MSSKVTIIIPTYNVEEYISRGIDSCKNQTYKNIEVILVDDGSKDNTADIIQECIKDDERFKLIRKENAGVSSARNTALKYVTGDYLIFLDSDDWLEENTVEILIEHAAEGLFVICNRYIVDEKTLDKVYSDLRDSDEVLSREDAILRIKDENLNFQSACYKLFDYNLINNANIMFDEKISHGEDGLFVYYYLQQINTIVSLRNPLWNILDRSSSASNSEFNKKKMTALNAARIMVEITESEVARKVMEKNYIFREISLIFDAVSSKEILTQYVYWMKNDLKEKKNYVNDSFNAKNLAVYYIVRFMPIPILKYIRRIIGGK